MSFIFLWYLNYAPIVGRTAVTINIRSIPFLLVLLRNQWHGSRITICLWGNAKCPWSFPLQWTKRTFSCLQCLQVFLCQRRIYESLPLKAFSAILGLVLTPVKGLVCFGRVCLYSTIIERQGQRHTIIMNSRRVFGVCYILHVPRRRTRSCNYHQGQQSICIITQLSAWCRTNIFLNESWYLI